MLAKGLDLPLVTLVGVVLADISLNLPDFRAAERTYQLLTQVAGRAGRSERGGRVVFQSFQPEHYAITSAATYDSTGFYDIEMRYREKTGYPPFSRLLKVEFRHTDTHEAEAAALATGTFLQNRIESMELKRTSLIGPVPCFYQRRSGLYRWQILVRGPDPRVLLQDQLPSNWVPRGITVDIVVDPSTVL
jgi:primosomal protein N' (replication factor Y)